ncbi:MAG: septum site-determining protein MinC [Bacterioplanes sp.]|nr:septum site-determining protein MinC [Bacterioplanes sp.]
MSEHVHLKSALMPLTTVSFSSSDLTHIQQELAKKKAEAPALFVNLPCILDLHELNAAELALTDLEQACLSCGLLPIAVRNADEAWRQQLANTRLADLGRGHTKAKTANPAQLGNNDSHAMATNTIEPCPMRSVKLHQGNIRSGQQVYFDGDLFVLGTINAGAEVLATGDIHVYGALRGRALAGVKGDETALISCQQFNAELISIAGQYKLLEEDSASPSAVLIQLNDGHLNIIQV